MYLQRVLRNPSEATAFDTALADVSLPFQNAGGEKSGLGVDACAARDSLQCTARYSTAIADRGAAIDN